MAGAFSEREVLSLTGVLCILHLAEKLSQPKFEKHLGHLEPVGWLLLQISCINKFLSEGRYFLHSLEHIKARFCDLAVFLLCRLIGFIVLLVFLVKKYLKLVGLFSSVVDIFV